MEVPGLHGGTGASYKESNIRLAGKKWTTRQVKEPLKSQLQTGEIHQLYSSTSKEKSFSNLIGRIQIGFVQFHLDDTQSSVHVSRI